MAKHYQPSAVLKDRAKGFLNGKYGVAVGVLLLRAIFLGSANMTFSEIMSFIPGYSNLSAIDNVGKYMFLFSIGMVGAFFITSFFGVFMAGIGLVFLKMGCNQYPATSDLFNGFRENFGRNFKVGLVASGLPTALIYVSSIVDEYYQVTGNGWALFASIIVGIAGVVAYVLLNLTYVISYFILNDFPEYTAEEVLKASREKMRGNKQRLFALEFSFVPVYLLGILTLGIGFIWIIPYVWESRAQFYLDLMNAKEVTYTWERTV